jgi:hypothetical protein
MSLETYRFMSVAAAGFSLSLNGFVAFQWTRAWLKSEDQDLRRALRGPALYPSIATILLGLAIYWRITDNATGRPFNPGDITNLVPIFGFLVAAWVSLGNYARVEVLMSRLTRLEKDYKGEHNGSKSL